MVHCEMFQVDFQPQDQKFAMEKKDSTPSSSHAQPSTEVGSCRVRQKLDSLEPPFFRDPK